MSTDLTKLRRLRRLHEITLDEAAQITGLSIGYINRIERGYITGIKNQQKRERLESYIKELEAKSKSIS